MQSDTDSQKNLERHALIAVKESDLVRINADLFLAFKHLASMWNIESQFKPGETDTLFRASVRDVRAVIDNRLLSLRLTENEIHDLSWHLGEKSRQEDVH